MCSCYLLLVVALVWWEASALRSRIDYRIVGGFTGKIENFPFMVSIHDLPKGHVCCGTLVTPLWVLTAGHCLQSSHFQLGRVSVVAGSANVGRIDPRSSHQVVRRPVAYVVHPDFVSHVMLNDVGLLLVERPFPLSSRIGLVPMVDQATGYRALQVGDQCAVVGWGALKDPEVDGRLFTPQLQVASLPLVDSGECSQVLGRQVVREELNICTYSPEGLDACKGDAGGPLLCNGVQVGVTSWGIGCGARRNVPGVFARVDTHADWIKFVTKEEFRSATSPLLPLPQLLYLAIAIIILSG